MKRITDLTKSMHSTTKLPLSNRVFANLSLGYGSFDEYNNKRVLADLNKNSERIIALKKE